MVIICDREEKKYIFEGKRERNKKGGLILWVFVYDFDLVYFYKFIVKIR